MGSNPTGGTKGRGKKGQYLLLAVQTKMIHTKLIVVVSTSLAWLLILTAANSCSSSSETPALVDQLGTVPDVPSGTTQYLDPNAADAENSNVRENEEQRQALIEQEQTPSAESTVATSSTSEQEPATTAAATAAATEASEAEEEDADPEASSAASTTSTFEVDLDEPAFNANSPVSTVGIGDVFFGMTPPVAAREAQTEWVGEPRSGRDCYLIRPINGPEAVTLWVYKGHIEGVSVETSNIRTSSGLGVGTTHEQLLEALGRRLDIIGHPTRELWTQAVFTPEDEKDAAFRVLFDLDEKNEVVRYWAGRAELAFLNGSEMFEREEC